MIVAAAEAEAQRVREEEVGPLVAQATTDGTAVITAQSRMGGIAGAECGAKVPQAQCGPCAECRDRRA
jgi:hypothetical protein